jgi:hypothetical protein
MRTVLMFLLAMVVAMSMGATAAATATAAVHLEEENEETQGSSDCSDILDNCIIHAVGIGPESGGFETEIILHPFGPITLCLDEFQGEILDEAGAGHFYSQETVNGPGETCNLTDCESFEADWPFEIEETAGLETIRFRYCRYHIGLGGNFHCEIAPEIVQATTHHYIIDADHFACENNPSFELNGRWELERHPHFESGDDDIEIVHQTD